MGELLYSCQGVDFHYPLGELSVHALKSIDLTIEEKEFVALAGPSGSGKTTLLNLLGLVEPLKIGEIAMENYRFQTLGERELNRIRRFHIGFIFQNFHLNNALTAYENVEYFLFRQNIPRQQRAQRVQQALELVGLKGKESHRPLELSGGQKQRVAIARALAKEPKVIIADEPTASLDQDTGREIMEILRRLNKEQGVTVILASHDTMVLESVERVIRLVDGRVVA
ncbi:MAG: ABC transporter ATP-binding protein [Bdellovibrionales bacterium]|jgi:putative ABC transport system ATP-binding protein|nr:ABC transporter ATP-binding protein [Bdellovibrionales bacterium]MBT3525941.1 ABC transporter ATP-binding protein [Bdellovibrionales bacterium]MBT7668801.1 ABC transporter ATP-binding protein [Bdellovibrionales bacterium]MBT7767078.1 ABC transporter ATP-binding protein [Bdellovibrionales bacterium]